MDDLEFGQRVQTHLWAQEIRLGLNPRRELIETPQGLFVVTAEVAAWLREQTRDQRGVA